MNKHEIKEEAIVFPVHSLEVKTIRDLTNELFPSECFILFLAADYSKLDEKEIADIAQLLISKGLKYILCWGNDCEKGHDAFDLGNILWEEKNATKNHVMSTWHNNEKFEEALWFCLYNAFPEGEHWDKTCIVVASVSNMASTRELGFLNDIGALNKAVGV